MFDTDHLSKRKQQVPLKLEEHSGAAIGTALLLFVANCSACRSKWKMDKSHCTLTIIAKNLRLTHRDHDRMN